MAHNDTYTIDCETCTIEIHLDKLFSVASKSQLEEFLKTIKSEGKSAELRTILHEKVRDCEETIANINNLCNQCEQVLSNYFGKEEKIARPLQIDKITKIRNKYVDAIKILMAEDDSSNKDEVVWFH